MSKVRLYCCSVLLCACGASAEAERPFDVDGLPLVAAPDTVYRDDAGAVYAEGPLTLLVVFDNSGSMGTTWGVRSKWQAANDALLSAVRSFEDTLTVGAIRFPTDNDCGTLPIEREPQFDFVSGSTFLARWPAELIAPQGNTPLQLALQQADDAIERGRRAGLFENRFRVVLFSDGEPTCGDDPDAMLEYPKRWIEMGIHTYVVGLPGSAPAFELLGALASAGRTSSDFGGGAAIANDPTTAAIYETSVETNHTENIVVDDEDDLDDVTHALAR